MKGDRLRTAIVILNWNGRGLLQQFLASVISHSQDPSTEIFVADNGSSDDSTTYLKQNFPEVQIIALDRNYGFAEGYNRALQQIEAEYYVILNSDVEVTAGWLEPCLKVMEEDPEVAAVQPKILNYAQRDHFEYAGAAGGFIDKYGYPFCRGRILNVFECDTGQYDTRIPIFWGTGACLFVRSSLFRLSGGFDPDFWAHMEEIDLCWRLQNMGYRICFTPFSKVYHLGGGTLPYDNPRKLFLNFRNSLWMLYKNLPPGKLLPVLFFRVILDGIAALHFMARLQINAVMAVIKAHCHFYSSLNKFRKKRRMLVKKTEASEIYRGSLIYQFYIKRKKYFSELKLK